jgi:3-oxoacyl-(acyl-carrier-protein) synthase
MWSPASMAAMHVAREAVADAGWSDADLRDAALVLGTSRGNAAGWLAPWPGRRPFRTMAVSNTIHNEPATAVSIDLGIHGPSHVQASGCSAGLDALGVAMMLLATGKAERALVVAVDLPLVPNLLDSYSASGLLSRRDHLDPFGPGCDGFIPAEAAAAIAIATTEKSGTRLICHLGNCDAAHPLATPADGGRTPELMEKAAAMHGMPSIIIPHATGTIAQARAEVAMFARMFPENPPNVCLLKPQLGHSLGASGLVETAILCAFLHEGRLPPALPGLSPPPGMSFEDAFSAPFTGTICKLAHSLGGNNSLLYLHQS